MADPLSGKKKWNKSKNFFFMNGKLYKVLYKYRAGNIIHAWDYEGRQRVTFLYSDVQNHGERSFSTEEVAEMMGVWRQAIIRIFEDSGIRRPPQPYSLTTGEPWSHAPFQWSRERILELHDYMLSKNWQGRLRKDGLPSNRALPTRMELISMMDRDTVLYARDKDGSYVPIWKAPEW